MTLEKKMTDYRTERDSIGQVNVPSKNTGEPKPKEVLKISKLVLIKFLYFYKSICYAKKAAAISNIALEKLDNKLGQEIMKVCDEIMEENLMTIFLCQLANWFGNSN